MEIQLEDIIIDNTECYICFEIFNDKEYILLQCCNKLTNKIHNICLFTLFLNSSNDLICPLCRNTINIKKYLNKDKLKQLYNKLSEDEKLKYKDKIDIIIPKYNIKNILLGLCSLLFLSLIIFMIVSSFSFNNHSNQNTRFNYGKF